MSDRHRMNRRRFLGKMSTLAAGVLGSPILARALPTGGRDIGPAASGTDVTFLIHGDTHFGFGGIGNKFLSQIAAMNVIPGTPYPASFLSDTVDIPRAVWIVGDVTEDGKGDEWNQFVENYGLTGADAKIEYPVLESFGNHDWRGGRTIVHNGVIARHGSLFQSRVWDRVYIANLGVYPGNLGQSRGSLNWLKADLSNKVGDSEMAVLLGFHYPMTDDNRWSPAEKIAFKNVIAPYNVVGIFHGHWHGQSRYTWQGYDVFNIGATKSTLSESFAAVHVTDSRMEVANFRWTTGRYDGHGKWSGWTRSKAIRTSPVLNAAANWNLYR